MTEREDLGDRREDLGDQREDLGDRKKNLGDLATNGTKDQEGGKGALCSPQGLGLKGA